MLLYSMKNGLTITTMVLIPLNKPCVCGYAMLVYIKCKIHSVPDFLFCVIGGLDAIVAGSRLHKGILFDPG